MLPSLNSVWWMKIVNKTNFEHGAPPGVVFCFLLIESWKLYETRIQDSFERTQYLYFMGIIWYPFLFFRQILIKMNQYGSTNPWIASSIFDFSHWTTWYYWCFTPIIPELLLCLLLVSWEWHWLSPIREIRRYYMSFQPDRNR